MYKDIVKQAQSNHIYVCMKMDIPIEIDTNWNLKHTYIRNKYEYTKIKFLEDQVYNSYLPPFHAHDKKIFNKAHKAWSPIQPLFKGWSFQK